MNTISAILCVCVCALTAFGQRLTLNGTLKTDGNTPVPATRIGVAAFESTTDAQGRFNLALSGDFSEGERVIINVIKAGWVINHPLDGEWNLPNVKLQNIQTLAVIIVPRGSKALWTHARIEKQIAKLSDEIARLKREGDTPPPIDFSFYLREWAEQYGFTPEQVKAAFDDWARAVKNTEVGKDTPEAYQTLGLEAFYRGDYATASEYFDKAAAKRSPRRKQLQEQYDKETLEEYKERKLAGNSRSNGHKYRESLASYYLAKQVLSELIAKEKHQRERAEIEALIGDAQWELVVWAEGEERKRLLSEVVDSYRRASAVFTREQSPQDWVETQNKSCAVADATADECRSLQDWAAAQNKLSAALRAQGNRMAGAEGMKLLAEAGAACRNALLVYTREHTREQWAATQSNLGAALRAQGERVAGAEGEKLLAEAVAAYRSSLQVGFPIKPPRPQLRQQWAARQNDLGNTLRSLGERVAGAEGVKLLKQAVAAYHNALQVRTRKELPLLWMMTQNNLGGAYYLLSEWDKAAECYVNVLSSYPDKNAYQRLSEIYHEKMFEYELAFKHRLKWQWLAPMTDFAETLFTAGRFVECRERIVALLAKPELDAGTEIALRMIEIANLLALGQTKQVPAKLDLLSQAVAVQPANFKFTRTFNGTLHFIVQNEKLAPYREWLRQLFEAGQAENRDEILKGLSKAKVEFKW